MATIASLVREISGLKVQIRKLKRRTAPSAMSRNPFLDALARRVAPRLSIRAPFLNSVAARVSPTLVRSPAFRRSVAAAAARVAAGAQGETGAQGAPGTQGPAGAQGAQGAQGNPGISADPATRFQVNGDVGGTETVPGQTAQDVQVITVSLPPARALFVLRTRFFFADSNFRLRILPYTSASNANEETPNTPVAVNEGASPNSVQIPIQAFNSDTSEDQASHDLQTSDGWWVDFSIEPHIPSS